MADRLIVDVAHRYRSGQQIRASLERDLSGGSMLALFGPSGSGKTTILRAVAGLLRPSAGRISFRDQVWVDARAHLDVPPQNRRIGYVAQETALFPHLSVRANVEYGLVGSGREARAKQVEGWLGLGDWSGRFPGELSGGQARRVALARAVAPDPCLLLLDEPFVGLDLPVRKALARDLRQLVRRGRAAAILVTHDPLEVLAMADDIAVMVGGTLRQVGAVADVFRRPSDPEVATTLGVDNVVPARVDEVREGLARLRLGTASLSVVAEPAPAREVFACIRAEDIVVERAASDASSIRNQLAGRILAIESEGAVDRLTIDCGFPLTAVITRQSRLDMGLEVGITVFAAVKATAVHVVPRT